MNMLKRIIATMLILTVFFGLTGGISGIQSVNAATEVKNGTTTIDCSGLQPDRSNEMNNTNPDGFSWHSSNNHGMVIALPLTEYNMVMLRAMSVGDWMSFPFEMEEAGLYMFSLKLGGYDTYAGIWQVYLDGKPVGEPYNAYSTGNSMRTVPMEFTYLEKGKHTVKVELVSDPNTKDLEWGTLISMGQVVLRKPSVSLYREDGSVEEYYNDANTNGVTVRYGAALRDIVLLGRDNGTISGDGLTADANRVIVKGLYEGGVNEGFSVVNGTSAKHGNLVLMNSNGPIDLDVDYKLANLPIVAEGEELVVHKNFNIEKPTTIVNTNAEGTRDVSILVGNAAPYVAKIDGEEVESTYADGLLSLTIPAGKHKIEIVGTHYCAFDQYSTNEEHLKSAATCAMPDVYYISCYCGKNGEETFTSGGLKDHRPYTVPAKEVTETEDGCIAHFACKSCDKVFADANCKQELDPAKVILTYTQPSNDTLMIVLITIGGLILITAALFIAERKFGIFKKKKQ